DGALYNYYSHGWYRWDFTQSRPKPTGVPGFVSDEPLAVEHGTWFFATRNGCHSAIQRRDRAGRDHLDVSAASVLTLTHTARADCAALTTFKAVGGLEL